MQNGRNSSLIALYYLDMNTTDINKLQAELKALKNAIANAKVKAEKVEKQQEAKLQKIVGGVYKTLRTQLLDDAKIDSENCVKISFTIDLAGNKFKETTFKKVLRSKLVEKAKAVKVQSSDAVSVKKRGFKKGEVKLQG